MGSGKLDSHQSAASINAVCLTVLQPDFCVQATVCGQWVLTALLDESQRAEGLKWLSAFGKQVSSQCTCELRAINPVRLALYLGCDQHWQACGC